MIQFIEFLDIHSGSLTVIITFVYVLATVLICGANIMSAKATRDQVKESQRQYKEEHRPYVTCEIIYERRKFYGMRFTNCGQEIATHIQISFDPNCLADISQQIFSDFLRKLQNREFILGIGKSYDVYLGTQKLRDNPPKRPIKGQIKYRGSNSTYHENFDIDFSKYATFFSIDTYEDDMLKLLDRQASALERIANALDDRETDTSESSKEDSLV